MNREYVMLELTSWLVNFVEKPNPLLGDWAPCPYARQARIGNLIEIVFSDFGKLNEAVEQALPTLENKDVVIICFDHTQIESITVEKLVATANQKLMPQNYIVLEDHPDRVESLNTVPMNFGKCGLLLIQKLSKLNAASEQLKQKGYYDNWPAESLDYVVSWRHR
jgi:hypothetical protein